MKIIYVKDVIYNYKCKNKKQYYQIFISMNSFLKQFLHKLTVI